MTRLRKMMPEELQRHNYSQSTTTTYIRTVEDFAGYFQRRPDQLGPEHIRAYQAQLFSKRELAPNTVTQRLAALRFFFVKTLNQPWSANETPYPKKVLRLPAILSQEEVARLIDAAHTSFHRVVLMTLYATGVRRAELAHRKVSDIDSQRMVINVQGGKGAAKIEMSCSAQNCWRPCVSTGVVCGESPPSAISRQSLAHRESSDRYQGALASVPGGCAASGYSKGSSPAHFATRFGILHHLSEFLHSKDNWP
jgi:hypothetical protein